MAKKAQKDKEYFHYPMTGEFLQEFRETKELTGITTNVGLVRFCVRFVKNHFGGKIDKKDNK